jgi:hypothetical protein
LASVISDIFGKSGMYLLNWNMLNPLNFTPRIDQKI